MKRKHLAAAWRASCTFSMTFLLALPTVAEEATESAPVEEVAVEEAPDATANGVTDEATPESIEAEGRDWINGSLHLGIDSTFADGASDVDFDQIFRMRIEPPKRPRLRLITSLWTSADLDGDEDPDGTLYDVDDSYGSDVRARLLSLYLEVDDVLGGAQLRIGRQRILDGPFYNRVDGLHLKWVKGRWTAYFYGGARASLYEDAHNDLVLGAGADYLLTRNTRVGLDLFYGDEHRDREDRVYRGLWARLLGYRYPYEVRSEIDNRVIALRLNHRFGQNHWLHAELLFEQETADEFQIDLTGYFPRWDLTYDIGYRRQLARAEDRVNSFTSYYRILGTEEQYHLIHLSLHKPITKRLSVAFETDWHEADNDSDYTGNRDYLRLAGILAVDNLFKGVDLEMALERWDVQDGEGGWVVTGEISKEWQNFELALGADYEQYKDEFVDYNPGPLWLRQTANLLIPGIYAGYTPLVYLFDERVVKTREEVYSTYVRMRWDFARNQALTADVRYEQDDGPDAPYWRIRAAYELEF